MITHELVAAWVATLTGDPALPVLPGPYVPDMPDRVLVTTVLPGAGLLGNAEPAIARPSFQVLWRGDQGDDAWVQDMARRVDKAIITAGRVRFASGDVLISVTHAGGLPASLGAEDDGDRQVFTCTYTTLTDY